MSIFVGTSFPRNVSYGETFFHTTRGLEYRFLGDDPSSELNWKVIDGDVTSDPDTTGWGTKQVGAKWFNVTELQWKGWNGSSLVLIG